MGKLTDTQLRSLKATGKAQKLTDGSGLYLFVSPSGGKLWRIDYSHGGKRKTLSIGQYPAVSLLTARKRLLETKEQLANGIDPSSIKKAEKAAIYASTKNSFEAVAREWFDAKKNGWKESHAKRVMARLTSSLLPLLGTRSISTITAPELLAVLRTMEERGLYETTHRALGICTQIFNYAEITGRIKSNPANALRGALKPARHTNFASLKDPKEVGLLLRNIDAYTGNVIVRIALQIAPYVFVRPSELRLAEWNEVDMTAAEWRIPASRMKMKQTHIVPLSRQVIEHLTALHHYTGHGRYVFPSLRSTATNISDATLLGALRRMGYAKDEMTVHGFRSIASTLLNELGYNSDWIERQLAHGERNTVRAAYNYAEHLPQRRIMMQEWADYLDGLKAKV